MTRLYDNENADVVRSCFTLSGFVGFYCPTRSFSKNGSRVGGLCGGAAAELSTLLETAC